MCPEPEEPPDFSVLVQENGDVYRLLLQKFHDRFPALFGVDAE
jgi:hypothetical protein